MLNVQGLYERMVLQASPFEKRFLEFLHRDVRNFTKSPGWETGVLCFPGIHRYFRNLIRLVAEHFSLVTCVISTGRYPITVVSTRALAVDMNHLKLLMNQFCENHVPDPCYEPYRKCSDYRYTNVYVRVALINNQD